MQQEFKRTLPEKAQRLCDELEACVGAEIGCRRDPTAAGDLGRPVVVSCNCSGAVIRYQNESDLSPRVITHELLHVQRYWFEMIPTFRFIDMEFHDRPKGNCDSNTIHRRVLCAIESGLEHLVIIPRESEHGFVPLAEWKADRAAHNFHEDFKTDPRISAPNPEWPPWPLRASLLTDWLFCEFLLGEPDPQHKHVRRLLRRHDLMHEAWALADEIRAALRWSNPALCKAKMVLVMTSHLGIPYQNVELMYFDAKNHLEQHARFESVSPDGRFCLISGDWVPSWPPAAA